MNNITEGKGETLKRMLNIQSDFSIAIFLPTSNDHVVDSGNIFIVGLAVVILYTHLCISCRCMLNKTKDELNPVWFRLLYRRDKFYTTICKG